MGTYTLVIKPNAAAGDDTYIYSHLPVWNFGANGELRTGRPYQSVPLLSRSLVRFDLSSLPANAIVSAATLRLYIWYYNPFADAHDIAVHRMKMQWYEWTGTGDTYLTSIPPADTDATTWDKRNTNGAVAWGAAGGQAGTDYEETATATATVPKTDLDPRIAYLDWDVTADITAFQGETTNYGWILIGNEAAQASQYQQTQVQFLSSDAADWRAGTRPQLTITYEGDAPPPVEYSGEPATAQPPLLGAPRAAIGSGTGTVAEGNLIFRQPYLAVYLNNALLPGVISANTRHGYNLSVAEAEIQVKSLPLGLEPFQTLEIVAGASVETAVRRFRGLYVGHDLSLYPNTYTLHCRGFLVLAQHYYTPNHKGTDMSGGGGDSDTNYILSMLSNAGIIPGVGPNFPPQVTGVSIEGLGVYMGTVSKRTGFLMGPTESALDWIQKLDAVCLGYRTFDGIDGNIYRRQISATPGEAAAYAFTEGVDIAKLDGSDTILEIKNRIEVEGWNDGKEESESETAHHKHYEAQANNAWYDYGSDAGGWVYMAHKVSSAMIEKATTADEGDGLSCQEVAEWLLAELNQRRLKLTLETPRDDAILPGDTIAVASAHLGLNQNFWVQEVAVTLGGAFSQKLTCIGTIAEPT